MPEKIKEPHWLNKDLILLVQQMLITEHGGLHGMRDEHLLDSALARPKQLFHYKASASLFELAASYTFGLARNHPFVDGNKRISFMAGYIFLNRNGKDPKVSQAEVAAMIQSVAAGDIPEEGLSLWYREHCED